MKNGRAYLPLRDICDMLGEDVGWEKTTKTSYVMQNGKRVNIECAFAGRQIIRWRKSL